MENFVPDIFGKKETSNNDSTTMHTGGTPADIKVIGIPDMKYPEEKYVKMTYKIMDNLFASANLNTEKYGNLSGYTIELKDISKEEKIALWDLDIELLFAFLDINPKTIIPVINAPIKEAIITFFVFIAIPVA